DVPDIRLVLVTDISNGADVIMAKPEIKSLKDLKGHRVGAETTALGAYVLMRALQLAGLKREDVVIVPLEFAEQEPAFKRGDVDAVVTFEPTRAKLLDAGARQIFDSSRIPGEIVDVLVVRNAYLQAHPENAQLFVKSFYRGQDYFKTNQQDALQIAAKRENTTAKDVLSSLSLMRIPTAKESRNMLMGQPPALLKNAQTLAAVMVEHKLLQKTVDVPSLFDKQALEPIMP
ncbi:MAG TPA: ABC transporter substrate-binding protein, partial [Terriglobales bacterium]|nr:ABC transporter substrate-binding protein [Terriglobales bacterium]